MADTAEVLPPFDWRGVPIVIGQVVLYGSPVGRSFCMVEGEVVGFTRTGRVNVHVVRRAIGGWQTQDVVRVRPERVTVVSLPGGPLVTYGFDRPVLVTLDNGGASVRLTEDRTYTARQGDSWTIPAGFRTDFASIPGHRLLGRRQARRLDPGGHRPRPPV